MPRLPRRVRLARRRAVPACISRRAGSRLPPEDPAVKLANPLSDDEPQLRTTLLPGLLRVLARNIGRGSP
jgi:phenylalanyl-tRNA synthetase beta subunit